MVYQPRIPVDPDYVSALGRATYNFAYLEWGMVWLAERLQPGYLSTVGNKMAGRIASDFEAIVKSSSISDTSIERRLKELSKTFKGLVVRRNQLVHGAPCTAPGGEQRLRYSGKGTGFEWQESDILTAAQDFETAAIEANALSHGGKLK
jgi:hypothetical protein